MDGEGEGRGEQDCVRHVVGHEEVVWYPYLRIEL